MVMTDDLGFRMATLARDLRSQGDPAQVLQQVVDTVGELIPAAEAVTVSLATRRGAIQTSASSSPGGARADALQMELAQGPCVDAVWEERTISVPDLRAEIRWPQWGPRVTSELGYLSVLCLRLFTHEDGVGALNLFSRSQRAFSRDDIEEGTAIAAHAAVAVVAAEKIAGLEVALDNRTVIGQATGLTMAHYGLSGSQAFQLLRRLSNEGNRKVSDVARDLVLQHEQDQPRPADPAGEQ